MAAFDTPRTKALAAFIAKEGPSGTGRVVGLSIEGDDGVFIYTRSAEWCDDNGSGTFHGDSETGAIAAFRERVQPGNGCPVEPQPARFGPCTCDACMSGEHAAVAVLGQDTFKAEGDRAMADSDRFVTVYRNAAPEGGRPIATLSRPSPTPSPREHKGLFTLHNTDGTLVAAWDHNPTMAAVRKALVAFHRAGAGLAGMTAEQLAAESADSESRRIGNMEQARQWLAWPSLRAGAVTRAARAAQRRRVADTTEDAERTASRAAAPRSLSAAATPAALLDGYGGDTPRASGSRPSRALSRLYGRGMARAAERCAAAIDESLALGLYGEGDDSEAEALDVLAYGPALGGLV